jgi:hypothetical protein
MMHSASPQSSPLSPCRRRAPIPPLAEAMDHRQTHRASSRHDGARPMMTAPPLRFPKTPREPRTQSPITFRLA